MRTLRMKRLVMSVFILILMQFYALPFSTQANALNFTDVPEHHWAYDTIQWAVEQRIVTGYPDGSFKPNLPVKEAEFLAMLFRAYPEIKAPPLKQGEAWYVPYYALASSYRWPVLHDIAGTSFDRGSVAQVVAASQGHRFDRVSAVQFLLNEGLSNGKSAPTVEGYEMNAPLTRVEAAKFIQNMYELGVALQPLEDIGDQPELQVRGLSIGDSEAKVLEHLGEPARKELSEYGFQWYIYHQDYLNYVQVGISDGKVVGLYTNSDDWLSQPGITRGTRLAELTHAYGEPLESIIKGDTVYSYNNSSFQAAPKYLLYGSYVTFFIDTYAENTVTAIQVIEQQTELGLEAFYGEPSEALQASYERQCLS